MTIPVGWAWPLGCLVLIGLLHTVLLIEEMIYRALSKRD